MSDNPVAVGPAGIAHMSILDFARWAGWNAGEGKRGPHLVKPETLKKLHTPVVTIQPAPDAPIGTPPSGRYAMGWGEITVPWAPDPVLAHDGSNGLNLARIMIDRKRDFALVITANMAGPKAVEAFNVIRRELYEKYAGAGK